MKGKLFPSRRPTDLAWGYRCYSMMPIKAGWKVVNALQFSSYEIPRSFWWMSRDDKDGLRAYIDMVTGGRKSEAMAVEERGMVTHREMDPEELSGSISIDFEKFIDLLAHRGSVDLPLKQKVVFTTNGHTLVPADFITILAKYAKDPSWFGDPATWRWASDADVERLAPGPVGPTSGMYRGRSFMEDPNEASDDGVPQYESEEPECPQESEIRRSPYDRYFELVTVAAPQRGKPYYVRRLARYHGQLLWSGSSYGPNGPWTEYSRDNAQLLALGLTP